MQPVNDTPRYHYLKRQHFSCKKHAKLIAKMEIICYDMRGMRQGADNLHIAIGIEMAKYYLGLFLSPFYPPLRLVGPYIFRKFQVKNLKATNGVGLQICVPLGPRRDYRSVILFLGGGNGDGGNPRVHLFVRGKGSTETTEKYPQKTEKRITL